MTAFIGHLHPVLVHLPIGFLLLAAFFQLLSNRNKYAYLAPAVSIILFWGMLCAVASCITGYVLAGTGDYDEDLVSLHQWMGISVAVLSLLYYLLMRYKQPTSYRWLLPVVLIILVGFTGHLGGSLTHGRDYLTSPFTDSINTDAAVIRKPIPDVQEAVAYTDIIQPVLQNKCYSCHGPQKQKGRFRMDQEALLLKGGKDGVVIEAGNPEQSLLLKRLMLDPNDEHHMPPKEKTQVNEKELALIHWWISTGASFTKKTKELQQPEKMKPILLSLQNKKVENKQAAEVPALPVDAGDPAAISKLTATGVVIIPVAVNSHYLSLNFVSAPRTTDKDLQLLLPLKKQIVWLKLSDTKITDAAAGTLVQCSNLVRLQLDSTNVTDSLVTALSALNQLQVLNLVNTKVTRMGLSKLNQLPALRAVYVYKTGINTGDWPPLKKLFPHTTIDTGGYRVPLLTTDTSLVQAPKLPANK